MNMSTIVCATFAGLASVAGAQDFSLVLLPAVSTIECVEGSTFSIDVIGDASVGTHMLGGSFTLDTNSASIASMTWTPASWSSFNTDNGYAGNGNYNSVIFGQLVIPGVPPFDVPAAGSELGGLIGSFQVTLGVPQPELLQFQLVEQSPFSLEVVDINTGETHRSSDGNLMLGSASLLICPAPSSCALFGFTVLFGARRRQ
ncbi:MAG: hypothetical protein CMJ25_25060 [Phycisphaerae bacterium]|nr:hypothetical protein [Phycisphaerae bacterium]|tara:strand:- start:241 stop:843 length:603 start_codon:yes stop_codon:yes gene_type:complete